jgi:hypothetical protein
MPLQPLIILGIVAMAVLAALRVIRGNRGLSPLPDGRGRRLFLLGFVVVPPLVLGLFTQPAPPANQVWGLGALPRYAMIVGALAILMWIASQIVGQVSHGRAGRVVRLALAGYEGDPYEIRVDPPTTARLTESIGIVRSANAAFPRGPGFPSQVSRAGFREDWDELDAATRTLEERIADDHRLGLAVASEATRMAADARSRLSTLRGFALDDGQAWATG